jgi:hypothetical protein
MGLNRTSTCWVIDHAAPLLGVVLIAGGHAWAPWLAPLGWVVLGVAFFLWLAESNGYSIPRPGRAPIVGLGCGEVPLAFGVSRRGRHFLFTRTGKPDDDDWQSEYTVYEVPAVGKLEVANGSWYPPAGATRYNAAVPAASLRFEHHEHSYVDSDSLRRALAGVVPGAA